MPCDNDPIDNYARTFMIYGGKKCRYSKFPNNTTVMFYLRYSEKNKYSQPIEAIGYLVGSYFNDKTNFPLRPGDDINLAFEYFGKEVNAFKIGRNEENLMVHVFNNKIHVITVRKTIIGFVIGNMPSDPKNEQWRGLLQMYQRYTPHLY